MRSLISLAQSLALVVFDLGSFSAHCLIEDIVRKCQYLTGASVVFLEIEYFAILLTGFIFFHPGAEDLRICKTEFVDTLLDIAYTEYVAFRALEFFDNLILKSRVVLILIDKDLSKLLAVESCRFVFFQDLICSMLKV